MHAVLEAPMVEWSELEDEALGRRPGRIPALDAPAPRAADAAPRGEAKAAQVKSKSGPVKDEVVKPEPAKDEVVKPEPSLRKLRANRRNARLSTGPRTAAGKARAAVNASTHGLYCRALLLPGESEQEMIAFRNSHLRALNPQTTHELMLVDQIFAASWKLRRLNSAERFLHNALIDGWRDRREALAAIRDNREEEASEGAEASGGLPAEEALRQAPGFSLYLGLRDERSRTIELYSRLEQRLINTIVRLQRTLHQAQLLRLDEPALRHPPCPFVPALEATANPGEGSAERAAAVEGAPAVAPAVARPVEPAKAKRGLDRPAGEATRAAERIGAAVEGVVGELLQRAAAGPQPQSRVEDAAPTAVTAGAAAVGSFCKMPVTAPAPSKGGAEKALLHDRQQRGEPPAGVA